MAESGGANEVEVKVVFKADTSELDAAKKSLGSFGSGADSEGADSGLSDTSSAADDAKKSAEELNETLDETGEKLGDLGGQADETAQNLEGLAENTESIGENLEALGEQADAAAQNLDELGGNAKDAASDLSEVSDSAEDIDSALEDLSGSAESAADQISAVGTAANETAGGIKDASSAAEDIGEGLGSAGDAAEKAAENLQSVDEAVKDTAEGLNGVGDSTDGLSSNLSDISEAVKETSENLADIGENSEAAADNLGAINDAAEETGENLGNIGDAADEAADNISGINEAAGEAESSLGNLGGNAGAAADQIGDVGASGKDAADGVEEIGSASSDASGHLETIIGLLEQISAKLDNAGQAAGNVKNEVKDADETTRASIDTFKDFSEAIGKFSDLGNSLKGFSAGLIAVGQDAIATAGEFEQLRAKLVTIQKSSETASETFEYAKTLAASTPFDVKGVVDAAVQLEVYGQNSKELLPVVANLASAMGGDLSAAATAMGRALSGSSEGLQSLRDSFGVNTDKLVKFGAALNKQGGIAVDNAENIEKLKKALVGLVNTEFEGGIERQAKTIAGAMANVEDQVTNTKAAIGDVFAPYVSVISEQVVNLLEKMQGFAPVIAVVGGLAAATTGLAGTFITAAASAVALGVATKALHGDYEQLSRAAQKLKASHAGVFSKGMSVGMWGGILAGAFMAYEGASIYLEKWIADEKKAQAEIAAQSKELVKQRQNWDDLRKTIEGATGAKTKFSASDKTPGAVSIQDAIKDVPGMRLRDELAKQGLTSDKIEAEIKQLKQEEEKYRRYYKEAVEKRAKFDKAEDNFRSMGKGADRRVYGPEAQLGYTRAEVQADINNFHRRYIEAIDRRKQVEFIPDKINADIQPIQSAEKAAAADADFLDFAVKAKDVNILYGALEECRKSLASLYAAGKGQTVLDDAQLKDSSARLQRMGELIRANQQDKDEFKYLKAIDEHEQKIAEGLKTQKELRQQMIKDSEQAVIEQFNREQAGRDQSLEAERELWANLLEERKRGRQTLALSYEDDLRKLKNGANPGERERLEGEIASLQHLTPGEIEAINKLHDIDKKQAAESLSDLITPLREAADELSGKVTAKPADQVAAWQLVINKAKEWQAANAELLAQSPELKRQFESTLKGLEKDYKQVQEAAANTVLTNLSDKVSEKISAAGSPTAQLDALRESRQLYEQTLRTSKELRASDAARQQAQKQFNTLKQQELKLVEQIKDLQKQVENETASIEVQIEEERLAAMQDRANLGEDMSKQILAQEQKIHDMRLQQLEEARKQELEKIAGTSEEAAKLRLATEKKYQEQTLLMNVQYQRKLAQQQRSFASQQNKNKNKLGGSKNGGGNKEEFSWKPGSPLMTLQEMLDKQNRWFASAGNDFMKDAAAKTNTMSGAAENAADKLLKLASSADSAASGLAGSQGSSSGLSSVDNTAAASSSFPSVGSSQVATGMTRSVPSASQENYFPRADAFGAQAAVYSASSPEQAAVVDGSRNISNYTMNFNGKASSGNAVALRQIISGQAFITKEEMLKQSRVNGF